MNGFSVLRMFPSLDIFLYNKVMFSSLNSNTLNINENTPKLQQILNSYVPKLHQKHKLDLSFETRRTQVSGQSTAYELYSNFVLIYKQHHHKIKLRILPIKET